MIVTKRVSAKWWYKLENPRWKQLAEVPHSYQCFTRPNFEDPYSYKARVAYPKGAVEVITVFELNWERKILESVGRDTIQAFSGNYFSGIRKYKQEKATIQ